MYKFKFADIGEGLHEGVVAEIYKNVGDDVKEGDPLFSVETDKVTSDIPSPCDGKVAKIFMEVGETIHVGNVVYHIDDGSGPAEDDAPAAAPAPKAEEPKEEVQEKAPSVVGDLEQSNDILDFSKFGRSGGAAAPAAPAAPQSTITNFEKEVDLIVIGSGPGGYLAGEVAGKHGLKTIVVEKKSPGGVCLNVGCIPTKTLLHSAKQYSYIKHNNLFGLQVAINDVKVDWKTIIERKNTVVKQLVGGVRMLLKIPNVTLIEGTAKIVERNVVEIDGKNYKTKNIIIATGSSPIKLPLEGFEQARKDKIIIDSTDALALESIPKSLAIIGGGVIGLEFATLYNEFGTKVTIIEGLPSLIANTDKEIAAKATQLAKQAGIDVFTNAKVIGYKNGALVYEHGGKTHSLKADKILESVGRRPNIDVIGENIGVAIGQRKEIIVDNQMRTNIPNILAIGDVVGKVMLAHVAYRHGKIAINTILNIQDEYDANCMPASIYTYPEISMIGKTEEQLKAEKIDYLKVNVPNNRLGKSLADGSTVGFTKLLFGKKYGEILGCHMINSHSSDIISEMAALMKLEATIFDIDKIVHPHPSISETIAEVGLQAVFAWRKFHKK